MIVAINAAVPPMYQRMAAESEKLDELLGAILGWTMAAGESNAQGKKGRCLDALRRIQGFATDAVEELKRT